MDDDSCFSCCLDFVDKCSFAANEASHQHLAKKIKLRIKTKKFFYPTNITTKLREQVIFNFPAGQSQDIASAVRKIIEMIKLASSFI